MVPVTKDSGSMKIFICVYLLGLSICASKNVCHVTKDTLYKGSHMDCRNKNLTYIPKGFPANTTSLDLSFNRISLVQENAFSLKNLRFLNLSFNQIRNLHAKGLNGVLMLRELYLENNRLVLNRSSYPDNVFRSVRYLVKLHIQNNDDDKGFYPEDAFSKLTNLEELKMDTSVTSHFGHGFQNMRHLKRLLLGFNECKLSFIQNNTFLNFSNSRIELLDLSSCPVQRIGKNAFFHLKFLKDLVLSDAKSLSPTRAVAAMYGLRGKTMTSIKMNSIFQLFSMRIGVMRERILSDKVLQDLHNVCVERLEMVNSKISWFGSRLFKDTVFSKCIKHLDLSNNEIYGDPKGLYLLSLLPRLVSLNMSRTEGSVKQRHSMTDVCHVHSTEQLGFTIPGTMEYLHLQGIGKIVGCVTNVRIYNAKSLKSAVFSYMAIEGFRGNITGLENLENLDISGNNFVGMRHDFLHNFLNLTTLILSNAELEASMVMTEEANMLKPLWNLSVVDLSFNGFKLLNPKLFIYNPVCKIDLSHNQFQSMPIDLSTTGALRHLDLSYNSISVFSDLEMSLLDHLASFHPVNLSLVGNLLSCGCQNLHLVRWVFTSHVNISYGQNHLCLADNGSVVNMKVLFNHVEEEWRRCHGPVLLAVSIAIFTFTLMLMTLIYSVTQKKTWLLNVVLRILGIRNVNHMLLTRDSFSHDAYIAYSDSDYQYICHSVRETLETRYKLKLFIRDRDTVPGNLITHEIIWGIDSSWKCVLFISNAFLNDNWCDFTLEYIVYLATRRPNMDVILVLCNDVIRGNISPTLLSIVEEKHIFRLPECGGLTDEGEWNRIGSCLAGSR